MFILILACLSQSPAEKCFFTEIIPYRWCFTFLVWFKAGRDDKTVNSLKICILSAFIISPLSFFANLIANLDLPEAVGPAKSTNFLDKINLF